MRIPFLSWKTSGPLPSISSRRRLVSTRITTRSTSNFGSKNIDLQTTTNEGSNSTTRKDKLKEDVPETLEKALLVFFRHPTPLGTLLGLICVACYRLMFPFSTSDLIIALMVGVFWTLQEWFMHRYLLHSNLDWTGRKIHLNHHQLPYHHVCIDDPNLVFSTMAISALLFKIIFGTNLEGDTAIFAYWFMGMMYIWCHFIVHTKYIPQNKVLQRIRQNHMKHHCKDSRYWFSFICPWIDEILNTTP